ncbi:MAG: Trans-aconitate 2-methyltransferase [Patescibacteria group bacterium]|nr:Trans-aconitate 2-methyltransferase [Patescibacteria group bacterium]
MISKITLKKIEDYQQNPITQRAIDHYQYDYNDICWDHNKKNLDSPIRKLMYRNILPFIRKSSGKNILEIGSGTSWLLAEINKFNPQIIHGIEPSKNNVKVSNLLFPSLKVFCKDFTSFKTKINYDNVYSLMTINHLWDITSFFKKCAHMMRCEGTLLIIIPNYNYFRKPRQGYNMDFVFFKKSYSININRDGNNLSQIVRKNDVYNKAAKLAGFSLVLEKNITIDKKLIKDSAKFKKLFGTPMFSMIIYKKISDKVSSIE